MVGGVGSVILCLCGSWVEELTDEPREEVLDLEEDGEEGLSSGAGGLPMDEGSMPE